ncbi:nonsense-mediated mRNA decay factor SMG9 isoform X2 [Lycorma delicatula]|uniref:nonsense-mediated mRNA decay factor SMG9 isoform X2 n=1 Tax=Lycorma delicatula TaxID=130591 RepID=UPI003F51A8A1
MGDREQDKGRDSRRKKFYHSYKDREEKHYGSRRLPIILTKPDSERSVMDNKSDTQRTNTNISVMSGVGSGAGSSSYTGQPCSIKTKLQEGNMGSSTTGTSSQSQDKPLSQPTIILRTREGDNRALSPNQRAAARAKKEGDNQPPLYQLAPKHSNTENVNPLASLPEMKSSVKLIEDSLTFSDSALEYLTDQTDFIVVGVIGLQGVGKSTLMSHLAGNSVTQKKLVFKAQSIEQQEIGIHCTTGIDLLVTQNRLILLDSQPVLSASVMDRLVQQDLKKVRCIDGPPNINTSCPIDFSLSENMVEVSSLQTAAFLLSVCHIVIILQDWFFDPNLLRFLQSAEMLKPPTPTTSQDEELVEYFPHVLFIQSYAQPSDFTRDRIELMQCAYNNIFARSRLHIQTGLGISNANVLESLSFNVDSLNLFLLPDVMQEDVPGHFKGHPGYNELINKLRHQLHGATISPLTHNTLTEKNWYKEMFTS